MKKRLLYLLYSLLFFIPALSQAQTATHVVISELYGGNGNTYLNDWVELYNPTSADVDMSGWSVQYNSATSVTAFTGVTVFPSGSVIKSHGYFLVQEQAGTTGLALPTPDIATTGTTNNFNMSGTAGKVALVNIATAIPTKPTLPDPTIVDLVAYGSTASFYEGTGPAVAPSATTSIERKASATSTAATMAAGGTEDLKGNGYDSDNNANDFFVPTVINPQNSASPIEPAGATATPTLTASPTTIDFGTTATTVNKTSAAQTFTLTAANLTASAVLTTSAPYSISSDGINYSTSITLTTATLATAQTISVKFSPTTTTASPGTIGIVSGTATQTVNLTGTGVSATPTLVTSLTNLTFGSQVANTSSTSQTFTLSGTSLGTTTTVSVAAPFAVSKDGISYSTLLTYAPADLLTAQTVYVNFTPTAAGSPTGTVTIASTGATSKTVALSGTATAAASGGGSGANIATHVVMSEVYGGGGNTNAAFNNDYVELYNPTGSDVTMTNWSIQYTSAAGTTWGSSTTLAIFNGTIKSHGFFLIGLAAGTTVTTKPLPTPDATGTINMSASAGKVALVNNGTPISQVANPTDATIVDLLGFYTAAGATVTNGYETAVLTIPTTVTANTWSAERKANANSTQASMAAGGADELLGNGYDINDNSNDFVVQTTPNPQNSASPLETPPGGTVVVVPVPLLTSQVTSLDFGTTQTINVASAAKTFTISGSSLTAPVTITTTAPFTVSADGITYGTSATFTAAQVTSTATVFVKFTPTTLTANTVGLTIASTGAVSQGVILTGTGSAVVTPGLTATPTALAFGNVNTTATSVKTFVLTGVNLGTSTTTLTTTAPYTISTDGITYAPSVTYTAAQIANSPTVSVKFTPAGAGASTGSVSITNPLITPATAVSLTATGVAPTLAATPATVAFGNVTITTTSGAQTFVLSGTNLAGTTTITTTAPYSVSKDGITYSTSITYTTAELATATPTVSVKYSPTILGPGTGTVTISSLGATNLTVGITGTGVAVPVPTLTINPSALTYSATVGTVAPVQTYTLSGVNLTGLTTVTAPAPYTISKDGITYAATLTYAVTDLAATQTVFVKFSPTVVAVGGVNSGLITNGTVGGSSQSVTVTGTGIGVPALTVTPTTLTFSQVIASTSAVQTYTLSGVYLTANTVLTATGPYTISKDGNTYATTLTYSTTDLATSQTVSVKFSPTVVGAGNGTITNVSTGAATQTITLNGTGLGIPSLTVTPATLTFVQSSGITSPAQTYTLTGANLTANTTVTTAAPYAISKDGITYSTTLTYLPTDLATAKTVYVTFTPTSIASAPGTITNVSVGATTQTVTLTGTGVNSPPTVAAIADQNVCYTTAQQSIALTGITPGTETTQAVTVAVSSSNTALFSALGVTPVISSAALLNYTIALGQTGTAVISVTVKDNGGTANGGTDTYVRTFNITVNPMAVVTITSDAPNNLVLKGNTANLTATGGTSYAWTASADIVGSLTGASVSIRPKATETFTVTATNASGCTTVQTISINVTNANKLETSNILTPNGDGVNDTWVIRNIDLYPANVVKVFDKAGKLVYSKAGYANDWNGYYNGSPLTQGTYYYVVDLGTGSPYEGYISLLRN